MTIPSRFAMRPVRLAAAVLTVGLMAAGCDDTKSKTTDTAPTTPPPPVAWQDAVNASMTTTATPSTPAGAAAASAAPKQWAKPPEMKIDVNKEYTATFVTSAGDIVVKLYAKEAPITVNNLVFLAKEGFYDNIPFHRVIPDFMIQGGDPTGTGRGGPGYNFADEVDPAKNPHTFSRPGLLAMANAGPATNGSQFFITHVPTPHLNGKHTIFGEVTKGQDIVNAVKQGDVLKTIKIEEK